MSTRNSGNDPYKEFAKQTYASVETNIRDALGRSSENEAVLIVVGEEHIDKGFEQRLNGRIHDSEEEPALASAFTEISALISAARRAGKDNIILSVEFRPETLSRYIADMRDNEGVVPDRYKGMPICHTLAYAVNNNIEIVASDPGALLRKTDPERREQMQRDSIAALVTSEDTPRVVVHIGGSTHIPNLSGYTNDEIISSGGNLTRDSNPFSGIYGETVFFNAGRMAKQHMDAFDLSPDMASKMNFAINPLNAIQIDAPGKMDQATADNIDKMVVQAAQDYRVEPNFRVSQVREAPSTFKFSGGD